MKTKTLLHLIKAFFIPGVADSRESQRALREVLEKLKNKERKLKAQLERESNHKHREELERKIRLVHTQRSKGLQLLKDEVAEK
ncbi:MAG TPA: hypothetical protein VIS52_00395 [Motiliproteus sp.]